MFYTFDFVGEKDWSTREMVGWLVDWHALAVRFLSITKWTTRDETAVPPCKGSLLYVIFVQSPIRLPFAQYGRHLRVHPNETDQVRWDIVCTESRVDLWPRLLHQTSHHLHPRFGARSFSICQFEELMDRVNWELEFYQLSLEDLMAAGEMQAFACCVLWGS